MSTRWIVDADGRDQYVVAEQQGEQNVIVSAPQSHEACERQIARLRARDAIRVTLTRRNNGRRLAATRREA